MSLFSSGLHRQEIPGVFGVIVRWVTYLAFFLVPLFFLPFTADILEQNKQMLLVILAIVGLVSWLGQMVIGKHFTFKSGWLNLVPGLFLLVVLLSSIFSVSGYVAWVGQTSQEYASFLSVTMFVVLFYLIANTATNVQVQKNILFGLLLSAALSGIVTMLGVFNLVHLPFGFAKSVSFNTIGSFNTFITFIVTVMFLGLAMWLVSAKNRDSVILEGAMGMLTRVLVAIVSLVTLVSLIVIDFWLFWVITILGVLLLLAFGFLQSDEFPNPRRFAFPLVLLLVSVLFLFLPSPLKLKLPPEVSPSFSTSWHIATSTLKVNTKQLFIGSGPGTYQYDFRAYKLSNINTSPFWSLGFDRAGSAIMTMLTTIGILGALLWLVLMVWVGVKAIGRLLFDRNHESWKMTYVLFVGWMILFVSGLLYSTNFTLEFLLWGLTGLLAAQVMTKVWKTDFSASPKLGLFASFAFVLVAVGMFASLFVSGGRYMADMAFAKAVQLDRSGKADIQQVIDQLALAVRYNRANDVYYRNLSSALLVKTSRKIADLKGVQPTADQTKEISGLVTSAVNAAVRATQIEPNNVDNWSVLGSVYVNVMSFAQGAEDQAAQAYTNAIRLEPTNPVHRTNLGRLYMTVADRARALKDSKNADLAKTAVDQEKTNLATAEQAFVSAIKMKNDYLPAHYYLAAVYERQGKLQDAAVRLQDISKHSPSDIGVGFEFAQLLIRLQKYDLAQAELERIITINPKYSNALWYLASMYEIQNKHDKAIEMVQKVVDVNPDNKPAQDRLAKLKAGETTTQIPAPLAQDEKSASAVDTSFVTPAAGATTTIQTGATKK